MWMLVLKFLITKLQSILPQMLGAGLGVKGEVCISLDRGIDVYRQRRGTAVGEPNDKGERGGD